MLDNLGSLVQTGLGIIAIASFTGVALQRSDVIRLRQRLGDYEKEVAEKERRLVEAESEIAKLHALTTSQTNDLNALGRVVTGEAHWVAIGAKLDEHHTEAKTHWAADEEKLDAIHDALRERR